MRLWFLFLAALLVLAPIFEMTPHAQAEGLVYTAVLQEPRETLKSLFPKMDSFSVRVYIPARDGSPYLFQKLALRRYGTIDSEFETIDTPYTFYSVKSGSENLGVVLGLNLRGPHAPLQLFVAMNPLGQVQDIYLQKLTSADVRLFREKAYRSQFRRFSLKAHPEEALVAPPLHQSTLPVLTAHHWVLRGVRVALFIAQHFYF